MIRDSWRIVRLGLKSLMLHKLRSSLTTAGILFGVASVIAMLSVGEGAKREALERFRDMGVSNLIALASSSVYLYHEIPLDFAMNSQCF